MATLDGLNQVDWARLTHAYGAASNVPDFIRGLRSTDEAIRKEAGTALASTIFHQGSRYRASAPAVPFLLELLADPTTPARGGLIELLELLAVGYPEEFLLRGFDPIRAFARVDRLGSAATVAAIRAAEPEEEADWEPPRATLWERDAYHAVRRGLPLFRHLTGDDEPRVRMRATRILAWFPADAARSIRFVRHVARTRDDPDERGNALHSLALMGHYLRDPADVPRLRAWTRPDRPAGVRIAAAIALAILRRRQLPGRARAVLLEAFQDFDATAALGQGFAWHDWGIYGEVAEAIRHARPKASEPTVAALCHAAERAAHQATASQAFLTLLAVTFPDPKQLAMIRVPGRLPRLDPARLTPGQLDALRAMVRSPVWRQQPFQSGGLMNVGLAYGLPWDPDPFRKFLEEAERHAAGAAAP